MKIKIAYTEKFEGNRFAVPSGVHITNVYKTDSEYKNPEEYHNWHINAETIYKERYVCLSDELICEEPGNYVIYGKRLVNGNKIEVKPEDWGDSMNKTLTAKEIMDKISGVNSIDINKILQNKLKV